MFASIKLIMQIYVALHILVLVWHHDPCQNAKFKFSADLAHFLLTKHSFNLVPKLRLCLLYTCMSELQLRSYMCMLKFTSKQKLQVEELVYLYVNSSERHQVLVGSDYFTSYVYFLVTRKMIDGLLIKSVQANMYVSAYTLYAVIAGNFCG